jgi:hypothetical protein
VDSNELANYPIDQGECKHNRTRVRVPNRTLHPTTPAWIAYAGCYTLRISAEVTESSQKLFAETVARRRVSEYTVGMEINENVAAEVAAVRAALVRSYLRLTADDESSTPADYAPEVFVVDVLGTGRYAWCLPGTFGTDRGTATVRTGARVPYRVRLYYQAEAW